MSLFVLRYVSCLGIFVLGLRAPGIVTLRDYYNQSSSSEARIPIIEVRIGSKQSCVLYICNVQECSLYSLLYMVTGLLLLLMTV